MARFVAHDSRIEGPGDLAAIPVFPLPRILSEGLAINSERRIGQRGLISPPEVAPTVVGTGPNDDEVLDLPVSIIVKLCEIHAQSIEIADCLLNEALPPCDCLRNRGPIVWSVIHAKH